MAWIDNSVPLGERLPVWPGDPAYRRELVFSIAAGEVANLSRLELGAHAGTHVDAPYHFVDDGRTVEKLSLDVLCGPCRVVDCGDAEWITRELIESFALRRSERVLFKTTNSSLWGDPIFHEDAVAFDRGGAEALRDARVRLVGIDYLSVGSFRKDGVEVHRTLLGADIVLLEGLDLSRVEAGEYELVCAPLLLVGAEGAPARALLRR